jgi:vacuolar protein sorting-associated protein 35
MDTAVSVELFVEILNRYVYYFDQQNETVSTSLSSEISSADIVKVTTKYLNGLIELIHSNLSTTNIDGGGAGGMQSLENPKRHFFRTLEYIKSRDYEGVVTEARQ